MYIYINIFTSDFDQIVDIERQFKNKYLYDIYFNSILNLSAEYWLLTKKNLKLPIEL